MEGNMKTGETKYLSDGRKVKIVGQLNNQETIVQEIFINELGDEIPSGERFVVKSLHDTPVLSYKEKRAIELEKELISLTKKTDMQFDKYKKKEQELKGISELVRQSKKLAEVIDSKDLKLFSQFLTGSIEYLVFSSYTIELPVKMTSEVISYDGYSGRTKFDGIKLISVLGRSDGNLEFQINKYGDGSGGSMEVHPFCTLDEALTFIKTRAESKIEDKRLSEESYNNCIEMGVIFSEEHLKLHRDHRIKEINKSLEGNRKDLVKKQETINRLENKAKELS